MNPSRTCLDARQALHALLLDGGEPAPPLLDHWRQCPDCRSLVERLLEATAPLEPPAGSDAPDAALKAELKRQAGRALRFRMLLGLGLTLAVLAALALLSPEAFRALQPADGLLLLGLFTLPLLLVIPIGLLPRRYALYKRLKPGRVLSGVCLGLSERTGTPAWPWRVAFVLAGLAFPYAALLYALLAVGMPVHPEDRVHLLRFRLARRFHRHSPAQA